MRDLEVLRTMMTLPAEPGTLLGLMPAYPGGLQAVGVKVTAALPANFGTEYDSHQGVVLYFDTENGLLRAIVDGTAVTAIRTGAVSGVATDLLARAGHLARDRRPALRQHRTNEQGRGGRLPPTRAEQGSPDGPLRARPRSARPGI